jgi:hypothetical protein
MPMLNRPGRRTGLAYIWLILLSPALLLLSGIGLLTIGLWREVDSVAAIGAVGVVASLLLPRMQGAFEIGPGGVKGDLEGEIFREVISKGLESGLPAEDALELAADASVARSRTLLDDEAPLAFWRDLRPWTRSTWQWMPSGHSHSEIARLLGAQVVAQTVRLDTEVSAIVERVATEKKWSVERQMRVNAEEPGRYRIFDFVINTRKGSIFIETGVFSRPEKLALRAHAIAEFVRRQEPFATFVVVPDGSVSSQPEPEVTVVEVGQLEARLRELPA